MTSLEGTQELQTILIDVFYHSVMVTFRKMRGTSLKFKRTPMKKLHRRPCDQVHDLLVADRNESEREDFFSWVNALSTHSLGSFSIF